MRVYTSFNFHVNYSALENAKFCNPRKFPAILRYSPRELSGIFLTLVDLCTESDGVGPSFVGVGVGLFGVEGGIETDLKCDMSLVISFPSCEIVIIDPFCFTIL